MMEKLAPAGEAGGCTPSPFRYISTITYKVVVYAHAERVKPLFLLYPYMYSVVPDRRVVKDPQGYCDKT